MGKTYRINELFYSLQGEGRWTGRPAVFVRFSGCNLCCPFCDTHFASGADMTGEEIVDRVGKEGGACRFVVLTGGEPTLQVDEWLVGLLHAAGYYVTMETNGTRPVPAGVDWVTCSPKDLFVPNARPVITVCQELKVVYDGCHDIPDYAAIHAQSRCVQPCDTGDAVRNADILRQCIDFVKCHPHWQLSLQTHKIIHIP